jgi:FKBP-type peptidyl-prolyl cis-trans isomerase
MLVIVAVACSNERETPKGYKFTLATKGDGNVPGPGKFLIMDLMFKDDKDSVWYNNKDREMPEIIQVRDTASMATEEGLDEVFRMLSKGDSVVMNISAQTLFEKTWQQPVPPNVDGKTMFTFIMKVNDVIDSAAVMALQQELIAKQNEKMLAQQREQLAKDTVLIDNYLKQKNIVAQKTASGLRYVITKTGKGKNAMVGQTVKIDYTGYLLSGKYFDTSIEAVAKANNLFEAGRGYTPFELQVGTSPVIAGWHEIMQLMNKGSKVTVYIPSTLAYGNRKRSEDIVENSILVFDMEMVDVK